MQSKDSSKENFGLVCTLRLVGGLILSCSFIGSGTSKSSAVSNSPFAVTSKPAMDSCHFMAVALTVIPLSKAIVSLLMRSPFFPQMAIPASSAPFSIFCSHFFQIVNSDGICWWGRRSFLLCILSKCLCHHHHKVLRICPSESNPCQFFHHFC